MRVLPIDVRCAVSADFVHFVTVSLLPSDKGPTIIEAKLFTMDTGREVRKASGAYIFSGPSGISHLDPQIGGDRVILGGVVADFATGDVFALDNPDKLRAVALTPDGRMAALAIAGKHSQKDQAFIQIWDLETRACVREFEEDDPEIHAIALSADGRLLAAGRHWEDFKVWDVGRGECLLTLHLRAHVRATAITSDGRFAVCSAEQVVFFLDLAEGCILRRITGDLGRISSVAITPDGRFLAAVDDELRLRKWDAKSGACVAVISVPASSSNLSLSSDGNVAMVGTHVINLRAVPAADPEPHPIGAGLTQDGTLMGFGREDGSLVLTKFGESRSRVTFRRSEMDPIYREDPHHPVAITFDRAGQRSVFAFSDGRLNVVELANGDAREIIPRQELYRLVSEVLPVIERDASRLRGGNKLEPDVREALSRPSQTHYSFSQVALIPDGKSVITAHHGDALRLWDIESGRSLCHLPMTRRYSFGEGEVQSLKPLPDNSGVVFTTADCALHRWRFSDREKVTLRSVPGIGLPTAQSAVSPCGNFVIWAAPWQSMEIRNVADGRLVGTFPQRLGYVQFAEWCSEDAIAVVVDNDPYGTLIEVWDTHSYARISKYPLSGRANALVTSTDSRRVVCCTEEGETHALGLGSGLFIP